MTRTSLSAIRKWHFTLSGMTQPVTEAQQATLQNYVRRLEFKVNFSVIIQVKYIFAHCPSPPAFQTCECVAGGQAQEYLRANTPRLSSSVSDVTYTTGAVDVAGTWTTQCKVHFAKYVHRCLSVILQLYLKKKEIQSVFYILE